MAASKVTIPVIATLVLLAVINCQDTPSFPGLSGFPSLPSFPGLPSIPGLPSFPGFGERKKRQTSGSDTEDEVQPSHQDKFFFNLFPTTTTCNFTTEGGRSCRSCTTALNCLSSNVGYLTTCHKFLPYCSNGFCSFFPGEACTATTTTTTTTTVATGN